jgi:hypothetical protein
LTLILFELPVVFVQSWYMLLDIKIARIPIWWMLCTGISLPRCDDFIFPFFRQVDAKLDKFLTVSSALKHLIYSPVLQL